MDSAGAAAAEGSGKTWGGRFSAPTDALVEQFTESIRFDHRLYRHDLRGSLAHARMLAQAGLLTGAEADQITAALQAIEHDFEAGRIPLQTQLEDIHTHIEQALIQRLGDLGRKLHTARSRNDQVATAMKLWTRDAVDALSEELRRLQLAFLGLGRREGDVILPGYTHLQRAQPILAGHYALAYVEKFDRDRGRLADARKRLNELPLGSAALAGTSLPIDRDFVRRELGFDRLAANSLDAVNDRDFLLETTFALSLIALHLSGWAEEWILWASVEFGFLDLPDAFCTGSSMMPHKKNPDVLELIRGKSARVTASLQRLMTLVKGLPLAYNRDLQEDKEAVFDAFDTVRACVGVAIPLIEQTRLRREVIASRLEEGFLDATTVMEALVKEGLPLRTAHETVGQWIRLCIEQGKTLSMLPDAVFDAVRPGLAAQLRPCMGAAAALRSLQSEGSSSPQLVANRLRDWQQRLESSDRQDTETAT